MSCGSASGRRSTSHSSNSLSCSDDFLDGYSSGPAEPPQASFSDFCQAEPAVSERNPLIDFPSGGDSGSDDDDNNSEFQSAGGQTEEDDPSEHSSGADEPEPPFPEHDDDDVATTYAGGLRFSAPPLMMMERSPSAPEVVRVPMADFLRVPTTDLRLDDEHTDTGDLSATRDVEDPIPLCEMFQTLSEQGLVVRKSDIELGELLVTTGFSEVYRANYNGTEVAVKLLRHQRSRNKRFLREARNLLHARHHIVDSVVSLIKVVDYPELGFVFPYYELGSLRKFLHSHARSMDCELRKFRLLHSIASALASLHWIGLIHRDVSSANILVRLVDDEPLPVLSDLGLSRTTESVESDPGRDEQSSIHGHMCWRAPEISQNQPYTFKADIFSLSLVFWEILAMRVPTDKDLTPRQVAQLHRAGHRPDLACVHEAARDLLTTMWDQEPKKRPSALAVIDTLNKCLRRLSNKRACHEDIVESHFLVWQHYKPRSVTKAGKLPKKDFDRQSKAATSSSSSSSAAETQGKPIPIRHRHGEPKSFRKHGRDAKIAMAARSVEQTHSVPAPSTPKPRKQKPKAEKTSQV